jgi:hypothetical protein
MAAKTIVTFHPDVACDMCGRRLLRGERPDVFMGGGQRRTVCELCTPRATHEGWRREVDEQLPSARSQRAPRGRSLLGRLRQLREPVRASERTSSEAGLPELDVDSRGAALADAQWTGIEREWTGGDGEWAGASDERAAPSGSIDATDEHAAEALYTPGAHALDVDIERSRRASVGADAGMRRALEIFNAGEPPRRIAGVTRALGPACVRAAPVAGTNGVVAIVVAWELCWYRYEIDLGDESAGVRIAAEGMELEELAAEDRVANAAANEHGLLSLLAS